MPPAGAAAGAEPAVSCTVAGRAGAAPIVLVHGVGSSSAYFSRLSGALASDWQVVTVDLPGFARARNRSQSRAQHFSVHEHAEVLARFLHEQHLEHVVLLGHSVGAQVVADLVSTCPGTVRGALLLGPTADAAARSRPAQAARLARDFLGEPLPLVLVQVATAVACGLPAWWRTSRAMLQDRPEVTLRRAGVPVLLVRGSRDRVVPAAWLRRLSAACPGSAVVEVPGAGHVVHWTHPAAVATLCRWWAPGAVVTGPPRTGPPPWP